MTLEGQFKLVAGGGSGEDLAAARRFRGDGINDDLASPVLVEAAALPWTPSPMPGVDRKMLFRVGEEVARATSIVRYSPGGSFTHHVHRGGEEILVLNGVFQDEHGDYPAGSYIRNPPGTSHVPASAPGCTIFVRLWQFRAEDAAQLVVQPHQGDGPSLLFEDGAETVWLQHWQAGSNISIPNSRGLEVLLVSGTLSVGEREVQAYTWCRLPAGQAFNAEAAGPVSLWIREAPLVHPDVCPIA